MLGGGTPKNFINQASVQAEFYSDKVTGHKYAILGAVSKTCSSGGETYFWTEYLLLLADSRK